MTEEISSADRVWLGLAGLALACAVVAISAYGSPLLRWSAGVVDSVKSLF